MPWPHTAGPVTARTLRVVERLPLPHVLELQRRHPLPGLVVEPFLVCLRIQRLDLRDVCQKLGELLLLLGSQGLELCLPALGLGPGRVHDAKDVVLRQVLAAASQSNASLAAI